MFRIRETKEGLVHLLRKNMARQFHEYFNGHIIERLVEWVFSLHQGSETTSIQFYKKYVNLFKK